MNPPPDDYTNALYRPSRTLRRLPEPLKVVLLGATGSIGGQAVDLALRNPDRVRIVGVAVRSDVKSLSESVARLISAGAADVPAVAVHDEVAHSLASRDEFLRHGLLPPGDEGLRLLAGLEDCDCVVNGLVGAAGLESTLIAARRGLRIALANKESLVVGGLLVREAAAASGAEVVPVDSEHSAIAQCLRGRSLGEVESLILTASGGPFREMPADALGRVTRDQVLRHPTWRMGPKITVDSATMMNKGLEIIEAHYLFDVAYDSIGVVVHPASIVHSLVAFQDGALLAQMGAPDMRVPLLYALAGERHWPLSTERLDLAAVGELRFEAPDPERFPCLDLARAAGEAGGRAPIVLNAANEEAVAALLADRIRYVDIAGVIEQALELVPNAAVTSLEDALEVDRRARETARGLISGRC